MQTQFPPRTSGTSASDAPGARRAIEVLVLFEDTIVDARHFDDPRAGTFRRSTRALIAGGAAALCLALVLFLVAYWEIVRSCGGTTSGDGAVFDVLALTLMGAGLASLVAGLLRRSDERRPRDFTVGPDPAALFHVSAEGLPTAAFPLLRSTGDDYELVVTPAMRGDIVFDGNRRHELGELLRSGHGRADTKLEGVFALVLPDGALARVEFGEASVLLRPTAPPRRYPVPLRVDARTLRFVGGTGALTLVLLGMMFAIPPDPKSLALERMSEVHRLAQFIVMAPAPPPIDAPADLQDKRAELGGGRGKAAKGTGGKMGSERSKKVAGLYAIAGPRDNVDKHLAKDLARQMAQTSAVLGAIRQAQGSAFASVWSSHESALGDAAKDVLGDLIGTEVGETGGVPGGLSIVGRGTGGPNGDGLATIGINRIGTVGVDGPNRYGHHVGSFDRRHVAIVPEPTLDPVQSVGMDKEIIRRVVRRHLNEIKFCYEQALSRHPDLFGRVVVQFSIGGTGRVLTAGVQSSTMNAPAVEQCAAAAVRRWEFPKPERIGLVLVSYPFVFNRAGQAD